MDVAEGTAAEDDVGNGPSHTNDDADGQVTLHLEDVPKEEEGPERPREVDRPDQDISYMQEKFHCVYSLSRVGRTIEFIKFR